MCFSWAAERLVKSPPQVLVRGGAKPKKRRFKTWGGRTAGDALSLIMIGDHTITVLYTDDDSILSQSQPAAVLDGTLCEKFLAS